MLLPLGLPLPDLMLCVKFALNYNYNVNQRRKKIHRKKIKKGQNRQNQQQQCGSVFFENTNSHYKAGLQQTRSEAHFTAAASSYIGTAYTSKQPAACNGLNCTFTQDRDYMR